MRIVYRVLAFAIAALVALQAASIAYAMFSLDAWIEQGGTLNKAAFESGTRVGGDTGFMMHSTVGINVVPLVVVLFVIFSLFAKIPGGVRWALYTLAAAAAEVALGIFSHALGGLGAFHGIMALVLFMVAGWAGVRAKRAAVSPVRASEQTAVSIAAAR